MRFHIDKKWREVLRGELKKPYMSELRNFLKAEKAAGETIYPKEADVFNALNKTPLNKVKVVIIGQDPYHGERQAHGLAFSVKDGVKIPPSLRNIYKEIADEYNVNMPTSGDLTYLAKQGVLLLNATLTVRKENANSHHKKGWEKFTDAVVRIINEKCDGVVFILWGGNAQKKAELIDPNQHFILKAAHPSPLSAHRGFFKCNHFKKANKFLKQRARTPIDWSFRRYD